MSQRGKGALNESTGLSRTPDSQVMFSATCKKSFIIENADDTCDILEEALNLAFEGRPGPVHIHIPKDITTAEVKNFREVKLNIKPVLPKDSEIRHAADIIADSLKKGKKMLALIGYGCIRSGAKDELLQLVEKYQIPFVQTMDAKGYLPENHKLCLGMYGSSGDKAANDYFAEAETVIAMGNSFAQNATFAFRPDLYKGKELVHINIDPVEIGKVYKPQAPVLSDIKPALQQILAILSKESFDVKTPVLSQEKY